MSVKCHALLRQLADEFDQQAAQLATLRSENELLRKAYAAQERKAEQTELYAGSVQGEGRTSNTRISLLSVGTNPSRIKHESTESFMGGSKVASDSGFFGWRPSYERKRKSSPDNAAVKEDVITTPASPVKEADTKKYEQINLSMKRPWYIINPEASKFMNRWDVVTMAAMTFVALITPLQVGLLEMKVDGLFICSLVVDAIFFTDMVLQFFLMYPVQNCRGAEMEHHPKEIIKHYLRTWFVIDFITIIPFDILTMALDVDGMSQIKSIKILRLLRLLKLIRILKTSKIFRRMEIGVSFPYQKFALAKFLVILILVCHWQSCVWAMTLGMAPDESSPRWVDSFDDMEADSPIKTKDHAGYLYVASFYFCSYTMTSVGYGDIGPKNLVERIFCICNILVAGLCWAYILGEVCGIVGDLNADAQSFRKKMDNLNQMMEERGLPQMMRRRLRSFFLSNKHATNHVNQQLLFQSMSPALQGEVAMALNKVWLSKVSFLTQLVIDSDYSSADRACIADVARCLDTNAYAQGESFGKEQVLYILYRGLAGENMTIRIMNRGTVWGLDFILTDLKLIRLSRCTALTYLEVLHLTRSSFMEVLECHKASCPEFAKRVRQYILRLAARRGVIIEARRRIAAKNKACARFAKDSEKAAQISVKPRHTVGRLSVQTFSAEELPLPHCVYQR
eukprot:TRINITY_DN20797_c0_g1_i1.p1 TRINITY_DN20797_c0_g1~~TRINITY_DN20797_c0_g1_i1.p1  ORF type:complete len:680 (-),score=110.74 TRINITY_DN20797_c0_g1_i1:355-2394(-)